MATPIVGSFDVWLTEKLTSVSSDIDTDVFVSYIIGILETEGDNEEQLESISGLLEGVMEPDTAAEVSKAILDEWTAVCERNKANEATDIGDKLSEMLEKHNVATVKEKQLTSEEKSRKAAILAQYAVVSDGEETDDDDDDFGDGASEKQGGGEGLLVKNVNKKMVEKNMKDQREKSKQDNEKKKEKDKQDRQAQKQKDEDRKQAEKKRTQKGERRR